MGGNDEPVVENSPAVLAADTASVDEDASVLIEVLLNDVDAEGDDITVASFTQGAHGTVVQEGENLRYTPDEDYNGTDSFTYTVSDGTAESSAATVSVTVHPVNDAPSAVNDTAAVEESDTVLVDVLANDADVDGDSLAVESVTTPGNGTAVIEGTQVRYAPSAGYSGTDSFAYTITDGYGGTASATVTVTIGPVNDPPTPVNDTASVNEDASVLVAVMANDTDPENDTLSISSFTQGLNGMVSQEGDNLRYAPDENYNGADSFTYTVSDGNGGTANATVSITVNPVNDAPSAVNDASSVLESGTVLINVLENDTDVDGDSLAVASVTTPGNGTAAVEGTQVRYTPSAGYSGGDSFSYTATDGNGGTASATVTVTIGPVNDPPTAANDNASVDEDGSVLVAVITNDTDPEGDTLSIYSFGQGSHGVVTEEGSGLRYAPDENYNGPDSFTYTVSDGNGGTSGATVNITVNPVNDTPDVTADSGTVNEDGTILVDVLANDTDVEGDTISIESFTQGMNGTVTQEGDSLRYTPDADYNGADSFTYTANDGNGASRTAT
ncbi:MAG: tandem-95 repeat protein, partial [Spirochaetales bacterium]|nr:tandem-95 repeat protein [Spirochaetales bacterium]